jgi:hypothetical protein
MRHLCKRNGYFVLGILLVVTGISGCTQDYDSGSDVKTLQDNSFIVKGKTTEPELIAHFGQPMTKTTSGDGCVVLGWMGSHATTSGMDPVSRGLIGVVAAGWTPGETATSQSYLLSVTVNKGGVVTDVTSSTTNTNSNIP